MSSVVAPVTTRVDIDATELRPAKSADLDWESDFTTLTLTVK
jgi:hypothetical protein